MSNPNKALMAVIALVILLGSTIAFVGSGTNGGALPTPIPAPTLSLSPSPSPKASGSGSTAADATVREFRINAGGFYFRPDSMTVRKGERVRIILTNDGGSHDLVIDAFNVRSERPRAGETAQVEFTADRVGTFEYYCSVGNHRNMGQRGTLTVTE